jgi:hypothetical protein
MLDKQQILETLEGYAIANELIERERIERLKQMTPEEARATFADLVATYRRLAAANHEPNDEGLRRLELWRLQTKIAARQAFDRIARAQGLL